ncbi:MAG: hypothetical protein PHX19_03965 [Bacilli bacterium]|nr:hypothetical protein [Bacilli bacterium]MDD4408182.1 hypothetical protein [Bacilli bacterium]
MKLYYQTLSKEKKKNLKEKFLKSKESILFKKGNKIVVVSIIGIIVAFISVIFDIIYKTGVLNYVLDGLLFIFSLIFLIIFNKIKLKEINKFALKSK